MARYIKANPKVAKFLHLENDRNTVKDGNYLLWQADMLAFGLLIDLPIILEQIGGIALQAHEAREEQDGTVNRPLPVATDPRFVMDPVEEPQQETDAPGTEKPAAPTDPIPGDQEPAPEEKQETVEEPAAPADEQPAAPKTKKEAKK